MKLKILLVTVFTITCVSSQNYLDVGMFNYTATPKNSFENSNEGTTITEMGIWLNYPIILSEKSTLITGIFGANTRLKLFPESVEKTDLGLLGLKMGIHYVLSDKHNLSIVMVPKLASDFETMQLEDFQFGILGLVDIKKNEQLKYKFGLYLNDEHYGIMIVPLFGLYYLNKDENFEMDLTLPVNADMNYRFTNGFAAGLSFDGLGSTFGYNAPFGKSYVSKLSNELFSYLKVPLGNSLFVRTKIGYSFFRKYEVYNSSDKVDLAIGPIYINDERESLNPLFKDGLIFKVEFVYRYDLTK